MNRPALDLTHRHFTRELGDLTVIGTWLNSEDGESEPCIVLMPRYRQTLAITAGGVQQRAKPCCIALSSAYLYDSPQYLLRRAMEYSKAMGFEDSMSRTHKIAEIIYESLDDLCKMPERPSLGSYVAADATITDESGRKRSVEIVENV